MILLEKNQGVQRSTKRAVHHPVQEFKGGKYLVKKQLFIPTHCHGAMWYRLLFTLFAPVVCFVLFPLFVY